jgi:hypothetical protein
MPKFKSTKDVNIKRGGKTLPQLLKELEQKKKELEQTNKELESKDKTIENLNKYNKELRLGKRPKYMGQKLTEITDEILEEIAINVRNGVFELSLISGALGIHRNTLATWLNEAETGKLQHDDIRLQLYQLIEYSKYIFFTTNQQVMTKSALAGDTKDAKWNLESRFKYLRTNATDIKNNINVGNESSTIEELTIEDQKVIKVKKEISYLIEQSINDDE